MKITDALHQAITEIYYEPKSPEQKEFCKPMLNSMLQVTDENELRLIITSKLGKLASEIIERAEGLSRKQENEQRLAELKSVGPPDGPVFSAKTIQDIREEMITPQYFIDEKGKICVSVLAEYLLQKHKFITFKDTEGICAYEGGVYREKAEPFIKEQVTKITKNLARDNHRREILSLIRTNTYTDRSKLDSDLDVLNVKNGLLGGVWGLLRFWLCTVRGSVRGCGCLFGRSCCPPRTINAICFLRGTLRIL